MLIPKALSNKWVSQRRIAWVYFDPISLSHYSKSLTDLQCHPVLTIFDHKRDRATGGEQHCLNQCHSPRKTNIWCPLLLSGKLWVEEEVKWDLDGFDQLSFPYAELYRLQKSQSASVRLLLSWIVSGKVAGVPESCTAAPLRSLHQSHT